MEPPSRKDDPIINNHAVLLLYLTEECSGKVAALNSHAAKQSFLICFLQNVLFNRLFTHQPDSSTQLRMQPVGKPEQDHKI